MRLRDREDRGFPSPLLLSYTSSFLPPPPCRSRCRWQGDADTSQSLPLSDEHLLPLSHLTLLFHICLTSLPVFFRSHISFCLSCFVSVDGPFPPFSLGSILSYLAVFSPLPPIIPALSLSQVDRFFCQGQADRLRHLLPARGQVIRQQCGHDAQGQHFEACPSLRDVEDAARREFESMLEVPSLASVLWCILKWHRICERDHSERDWIKSSKHLIEWIWQHGGSGQPHWFESRISHYADVEACSTPSQRSAFILWWQKLVSRNRPFSQQTY